MRRLLATLLFGLVFGASAAAWSQALPGRDLDGDGGADAYYDLAQDITWLADGNYAAGSAFGSIGAGELGWQLGWMSAGVARSWADSLDIGGITGWRLSQGVPRLQITNSDELCLFEYCTLASTEMGTLYAALGQSFGPLVNVQSVYYLDVPAGALTYTAFGPFIGGATITRQTTFPHAAWAVHDGDVGIATAVPAPATYVLMLLGLAGILGHGLLPNSKAPMSRVPTLG